MAPPHADTSAPPPANKVAPFSPGITKETIAMLADRALTVLDHQEDHHQVFIGVAGGPGSGKSTVAEEVSVAINDKVGSDISCVVPMDGYHIPKVMLEELAQQGKIIGDPAVAAVTGRKATFEDLMSRRGAPWTFDPKALYKDLKSAKETGFGSFPIYCRMISDPRLDGVIVDEKKRIILCEGNYLLAFDEPDWAPLKEIWDDKWYIHVPEPIVKERLINRHLMNWTDEKVKRFGKGRDGAAKKVEESDILNSRWIESNSKQNADLVIQNT